MRKQKTSALSNTKIAIVFFALLVFIVVVSFICKIIIVIKNGQIDSSRSINLSISNDKNTEIMSLSPSLKSITIFKLSDKVTSSEAGRLLEIPLDGSIVSGSLNLNQKANSLFKNLFLSYNKLRTSLTIIDIAKLIMLSGTVSENNINTLVVNSGEGSELDATVSRLISDTFIQKDNKTIQIINGTEVSGLGNRLARIVTNMGGNVIIVATSESTRKESYILYSDKKSYTVERLEKMLGYKAMQEEKKTISDITIIIGEDKVDSSPF
jgi:hypothetical protein